MKRFIQGEHRGQSTLLPESLDDYVADTNPVRVVDVFVDELDLGLLGFEGVVPAETGRPAYHPADLLKIYIYGYLNRIQSSRRLERESQRNVELMWLTGRLMPDFKTIANFRKDNGKAIRGVCRQFVVLCQQLGLFSEALVAIDGSKFKAVNNRDRNFTSAKLQRRMEEIESSINPDRVKTQQTMTINFRGFSQRLGGRRRPNQAQSIILVAMALSASVRLLEGGTSRRTGLRPSSLPSGHRCPARSTRV